jgi:hypothetical protein
MVETTRYVLFCLSRLGLAAATDSWRVNSGSHTHHDIVHMVLTMSCDCNQSQTACNGYACSPVHSELSWWGLKSSCICMSHICIIAVTTALNLPFNMHSVNLVPHIAFWQSLACARSPYQHATETFKWHWSAVHATTPALHNRPKWQ